MIQNTSTSRHNATVQRSHRGGGKLDGGSWGRAGSTRSGGGRYDRKDQWVTKRELAEHLRVSPRFIELQQQLGLPVFRMGTVNRYRISEVEEWARAQYSSDADDRSA